jgi:hypothetical protein
MIMCMTIHKSVVGIACFSSLSLPLCLLRTPYADNNVSTK